MKFVSIFSLVHLSLSVAFLVKVENFSQHGPKELRQGLTTQKEAEYQPTHTKDQSEHDELSNSQQQHNSITSSAEGSHHNEHELLKPSESQFWLNILLAIFLSLVGAFCSGMTVGFLSIERMQLEIMEQSPSEEDNKVAKRILNVLRDHHLFLVTLLLANAIALESLPLVIHTLLPELATIIFSTFIVVIAAEIVPQAYCTGPKKIEIAYMAAPVIEVMEKFFWVAAYPIARGLDSLLAHHSDDHNRIKHKDFSNFLNQNNILQPAERLLLCSTLELRRKRVGDVMVPAKSLFMVSDSQIFTERTMEEIHKKDYSHILMYRGKRDHIVGSIKTKQLALKHLKGEILGKRARDVISDRISVLEVYSDTNLLQMLMLFQSQSMRVALVRDQKKKVLPNMESIMYSKSDMIVKRTNSTQIRILGAVFLYTIFEEIAKYKRRDDISETTPNAAVQLTQIDEPLLAR